MITLNWMQITIITFTAIYLVIEFLTKNEIKDERYHLIELKSQALVSKLTASALVVISLVYIFYPETNALYMLFVLAMTFLATEILAKQFYKRKL